MSPKSLYVSTYGDGFNVYHVDYRKVRSLHPDEEPMEDSECGFIQETKKFEDRECRKMHKHDKTKNSKFNSLVKIGKSKWLCFDWDQCRYVTWDSKKQSLALFKQRLNEASTCILGTSLEREYR